VQQDNKVILLVEDNPDDVALTMRAFKRCHLANPIAVVRDGVEALDFLFARNDYQVRASQPLPTLVILDLKLPRLDGLGVLKAIRAAEHMRFLPVVTWYPATRWVPTATYASRSTSPSSSRRPGCWASIG
jgi:two-component system response regulator